MLRVKYYKNLDIWRNQISSRQLEMPDSKFKHEIDFSQNSLSFNTHFKPNYLAEG